MAEPTPERRRELLRELTQQAIEAGTYAEPAPEMRPAVAEHTPQEDTTETITLSSGKQILMPKAAPVAAEGLRERIAKALIARIKQSVIINPAEQPGTVGQPFAATEYDLADAVLAELVGDPGDLREQTAAALARHHVVSEHGDWTCVCGGMTGTSDWNTHLAEVALGVRDEHLAVTVAKLDHALAENASLRDHRVRWGVEKARADKAEARVAELENALNWQTSCLACSTVLDSSIADHDRAEAAEAQVAALREELATRKAKAEGICIDLEQWKARAQIAEREIRRLAQATTESTEETNDEH